MTQGTGPNIPRGTSCSVKPVYTVYCRFYSKLTRVTTWNAFTYAWSLIQAIASRFHYSSERRVLSVRGRWGSFTKIMHLFDTLPFVVGLCSSLPRCPLSAVITVVSRLQPSKRSREGNWCSRALRVTLAVTERASDSSPKPTTNVHNYRPCLHAWTSYNHSFPAKNISQDIFHEEKYHVSI